MKYGTHYFSSQAAALRHYSKFGVWKLERRVQDMIEREHIRISRPPVIEGQTITLDVTGRYWIEES